MTTLREAAEQALEALDSGPLNTERFLALQALRQALEVEQDEPVAYAVPGAVKWKRRQSEVTIKLTRKPHPEYGFTEPLYTSPQPAQPAIPPGWKLVPLEPTTEMVHEIEHASRLGGIWTAASIYQAMLYAAPEAPAQQPLTEEQINALLLTHGRGDDGFHGFARAIERAHGIG